MVSLSDSLLGQGDDTRWSFGAAFAIPYGPAGAMYGTYLPFEWFTKQLRWTCRGCAAWVTSWRLARSSQVLNTQRIRELSVYALQLHLAVCFLPFSICLTITGSHLDPAWACEVSGGPLQLQDPAD